MSHAIQRLDGSNLQHMHWTLEIAQYVLKVIQKHPEAKLSMTCPIKHRPLSLIINLACMDNNQIKQWIKVDYFDLFIW